MSSLEATQKIVRLRDVQSRADDRALRLDAVGVGAVRHPVIARLAWRV